MSGSTIRRIRIVCVSDTHNDDPTDQIPAGDVFIHAGDMTDYGKPEELDKAFEWIRKLPHQLKIVIAGTKLRKFSL
jgi:3',5'-cyclic AMP phosphodiesterase CpdA